MHHVLESGYNEKLSNTPTELLNAHFSKMWELTAEVFPHTLGDSARGVKGCAASTVWMICMLYYHKGKVSRGDSVFLFFTEECLQSILCVQGHLTSLLSFQFCACCATVGSGHPADITQGAPGKHTSFYYIKTNSADTCDKMKLNNASSLGPMLTQDDKSYLKHLCLTWFYYVERKQAQDECKTSLTWEWTVRLVNLNSSELLLNWPLCVQTPDGKCLSLPLAAIKTRSLPPNAVSRMLKCVLLCCSDWCI